MSSRNDWKRVFRLTESRRHVETQVDEELNFLIDNLIERFTAQGLSEEEARAEIQRRFNGLESTRTALIARSERAVRRSRCRFFLNGLGHDLRYGLRQMLQSPGFTFVVLLTLALGIGATSTILSLVNGMLLRPLPYKDSDRMVILWERLHNFPDAAVSWPDYLDWRERNTVFEAIACYNSGSLNLTGDGNPVELSAARITASSFDLIGIEPVVGRAFTPEDDMIGAERVTILSWGFWHDRLGGDPGVLGWVLTLDDESYTVVGVTGRDFIFPPNMRHVDLYVPIAPYSENWIDMRDSHPGIVAIGRLRPGVELDEARADLERVAIELEQKYPDTNTGTRINSMMLHTFITEDSATPLLILLLAVGLLLLIACANVANILLVRATTRQHELAVRSTLGAGGGLLIRLLLAESLLLWLAGGGGWDRSGVRRHPYPGVHPGRGDPPHLHHQCGRHCHRCHASDHSGYRSYLRTGSGLEGPATCSAGFFQRELPFIGGAGQAASAGRPCRY